jgi:hypothetical protein
MKKDYLADKTALLNSFHENREELLACARTWPTDQVDTIFLGEWSLLDLLAHISGWDDANRAAITAVQAGRLPEFYGHKDPDWRTYNASHVRKYRRQTLEAQLALVEDTFGKLMEALTQLDAEDLFRDYGVRYKGWKVIIARLVESDMKDVRIHIEQMRAWLVPLSLRGSHEVADVAIR